MITRIRQMIAYHLSILLILISFGLIKPDVNIAHTSSASDVRNTSEISRDIGDPVNKKST